MGGGGGARRPQRRHGLLADALCKQVTGVEGSAVDGAVVAAVVRAAAGKRRVMVVLDSNHTSEHVLRELTLYSPMVKKDGYLVVMDTVVEHMAPAAFPDRAWGSGNSPLPAVREFLARDGRLVVALALQTQLLLTFATSGSLLVVTA